MVWGGVEWGGGVCVLVRVQWWDGGMVGWWDGGMVGWWDGGEVGWWWGGGVVGWWGGAGDGVVRR